MDYKARPTTYAGVRFRSRLEARWAAFFDLLEYEWDYEPFDLDGWTPDFLLIDRVTLSDGEHVFRYVVEVKPIQWVGCDVTGREELEKVFRYVRNANHEHDAAVVLGATPLYTKHSGWKYPCLGVRLLGDATEIFSGPWLLLSNDDNTLAAWREAGNQTQWRGQ